MQPLNDSDRQYYEEKLKKLRGQKAQLEGFKADLSACNGEQHAFQSTFVEGRLELEKWFNDRIAQWIDEMVKVKINEYGESHTNISERERFEKEEEIEDKIESLALGAREGIKELFKFELPFLDEIDIDADETVVV